MFEALKDEDFLSGVFEPRRHSGTEVHKDFSKGFKPRRHGSAQRLFEALKHEDFLSGVFEPRRHSGTEVKGDCLKHEEHEGARRFFKWSF